MAREQGHHQHEALKHRHKHYHVTHYLHQGENWGHLLSTHAHEHNHPALEHVNEHPAHRFGLAERCRADVIQVEFVDYPVGRGSGPTVVLQDFGSPLIWLGAHVGVRVPAANGIDSLSRPNVSQNQPYSTLPRCFTRPSRLVPDGVIGRRSCSSGSPSTFHTTTWRCRSRLTCRLSFSPPVNGTRRPTRGP